METEQEKVLVDNPFNGKKVNFMPLLAIADELGAGSNHGYVRLIGDQLLSGLEIFTACIKDDGGGDMNNANWFLIKLIRALNSMDEE